MGPSTRTRRDLIEQKAADIFTGRREEIAALTRALTDPQSFGFINIYGMSGIGKTFLVYKIIEKAKSQQCMSTYIDLAFCGSRIALLHKISLSITTPYLPDTDNACLSVRKRYRDLHVKVQNTNLLSPSALAQLSRLSDFEDVELSSSLPSQASSFGQNDLIALQNILGADYQFFCDPSSELAKALVLDMNRLSNSRPSTSGMIIALDRSEKVSENLLTWFRDQVFYDFGENVILLVAGQRPLQDGWDDLLKLGLSIELKPLNETETGELAAKLGVDTPDARAWVYKASGGVPLFATTLCRAYSKDPRLMERDPLEVSPPESVMERYLSAINPEQRDAVLQGAMLRYISQENANAIFGATAAQKLLSAIRQLHFVTDGQKGYVIHDRARDYLNRYFLAHNPARYYEISEASADYYKRCGARGIQVFDSLIEELYHRIRSGEKTGLNRLKEAFDDHSLLNQPQECEALVGTALLAGLDAPSWIALFHAAILYQRTRFNESRERLREQLSDIALAIDQELRGLTLYYFSITSWYLCDFEVALAYAKRTVDAFEALVPDDLTVERRKIFHMNRAIGIIGLTQDRLGKFQEGIDTVQRMAEAARVSRDLTSLGYALNSLGYFSWHNGDWRAADSFFAESIAVWGQLQNSFGACYPLGLRAALRFLIGDPQYSIETFRRCLEASILAKNKEMECKSGHNYAEALWVSHRYEECIDAARLSEGVAEELQQSYFLADVLRVKALGHIGLGQLEAAEASLGRSLSIADKLRAPYVRARVEAVAFVGGIGQHIGLPEFDFFNWIKVAVASGNVRAVFDFALASSRLGSSLATNDALAMMQNEHALRLLLLGALRLNMNALLIFVNELIAQQHIDLQCLCELVADGDSDLDNLLDGSIRRGIREVHNSRQWDILVEALRSAVKN